AEIRAAAEVLPRAGLAVERRGLGQVAGDAATRLVKDAELEAARGRAAVARALEERPGRRRVLGPADPVPLHDAGAMAGPAFAAFAGRRVESARLPDVLGHALALLVREAQVVAAGLHLSVARLLEERGGERRVLRAALARLDERTEAHAAFAVAR